MSSDSGPREEDRPVAVEISDNMLRVTLRDGRMIATPLDWYPRLADEDLSVSGTLRGVRPPQNRHKAEAGV